MEEETQQAVDRERWSVLREIEDLLETPVRILGFIWLALLVAEFLLGENRLITIAVYSIWAVFLLDFAIRFILAPKKAAYLRNNWLTVLSLAVPALRFFAVFRALWLLRLTRTARVARGLRLVKVLGSLNRGMRALRGVMARRGFGYVITLTAIVILVGAAGIYAFEGPSSVQGAAADPSTGPNRAFETYGDALWWTAMIMTTLGSDGWPQSSEGRILTLLLSLYAFAIFGYVTATLASFFIGREAETAEAEAPGSSDLAGLREEIRLLREEIEALREK